MLLIGRVFVPFGLGWCGGGEMRLMLGLMTNLSSGLTVVVIIVVLLVV